MAIQTSMHELSSPSSIIIFPASSSSLLSSYYYHHTTIAVKTLMQEEGSPPTKKSLLQKVMASASRSQPQPQPEDDTSPQDVNTLLAELFELRVEEMALDLDEMAYQGFQPREFLKALKRKGKNAGMTNEVLRNNLVYLGALCAMRGSKVMKLINSNGTSEKTKAKLSPLIRAFDIKEGRPSGPLTVTLPRILAVTTIPVSRAVHADKGQKMKLPITPGEVAEGFPYIFCMSHAGGLLPCGVDYPIHWYKAVAFGQYIMSLKFGARATKEQALQFVHIASRSNLWSNENKLTLLHCN